MVAEEGRKHAYRRVECKLINYGRDTVMFMSSGGGHIGGTDRPGSLTPLGQIVFNLIKSNGYGGYGYGYGYGYGRSRSISRYRTKGYGYGYGYGECSDLEHPEGRFLNGFYGASDNAITEALCLIRPKQKQEWIFDGGGSYSYSWVEDPCSYCC